MAQTWVISDPHFGHDNILRFKNEHGEPLRPGFIDIEHMNETLVGNWNAVVHPDDRVYLLGDVAFKPAILRKYIPRLLGRIVLVKGNHDCEKLGVYQELFDDVRACVCKKGFILTHIPIHPGSLGRWKINIHGHTHANKVVDEEVGYPDSRYVCVSVEQINYRPKLLDDILKEKGLP